MEYRCVWITGLFGGYVVYRHFFDTAEKCSIEDMARVHKVAAFVCESDADAYCEWQNAEAGDEE